MDGLNFYFNGKWASDLGITLVSLNSGLKKESFMSEREIISESIPSNPVPYVFGVQNSPKEFTLVLASLTNAWTTAKRREIARWLDTENFEEFYSEDDTNKRYYFMYKGGIDLNYDAELKGYIEVQMLNVSPYAYSPSTSFMLDCTLQSPTLYTFNNDGDMILKPELSIYKVGSGNVSIINNSNNGKEFKFTGLADKETVYIDNQNPYIQSDIPLTLRYDNFNQNYLELLVGTNNLSVTGSCKITFSYQTLIKG